MFAVLRVRGTSKLDTDVKDTLKILGLNKPNHCVILPNNTVYLGMLKKVQGCVAWGEIKPEVLEKLIERRGRPAAVHSIRGSDAGRGNSVDAKKIDAKASAKKILDGKQEESGVSQLFKLSPPKKGFAKKGVLRGFNQGGELGYQKEKINELIERMI